MFQTANRSETIQIIAVRPLNAVCQMNEILVVLLYNLKQTLSY